MKKNVFFKDGNLFFDTGLSEAVFVKTGLTKNIREEGGIVEFSDGKWSYSPWNFDSTVSSLTINTDESIENETVLLSGEGFIGSTLHEILSSSEKDTKIKASIAFFCAIDCAFDSGFSIENIGAGEIFISSNFDKVLFLPKTLFSISLSSLEKKEATELHGFYVNPVFKGKSAIHFTQAVVLYRALSGVFPFTKIDAQKRYEDIIDLNYTPLRYLIPGIDERLLAFTEASFSGKKTDTFPIEVLSSFHEKPLTESDDFSFCSERKKFLERKEKRISIKRWFRAKSWAIRIASAIVVIALVLCISLYRSSLEKPTTKGLSAFETIEMYYSAINLLDVDSMRRSSTKSLSPRADRISDTFVTGKAKAMYNPDTDLLPPAVWFVQGKSSRSIYGLSNFLIDGENASLFKKGAKKKEKPKTFSSPDSFPGSTKTFTVSFYILDLMDNINMSVVPQRETVRVIFQKDRWIIQDIQTKIEKPNINLDTFRSDFENAKKESLNDTFLVAKILRQKYDFIPSDKELEDATRYFQENALFFSSSKLSF